MDIGNTASVIQKRTREEIKRSGKGVSRGEHKEGQLTRRLEYFTSNVPSGFFLGAALVSMGISALLRLDGDKEDANFVGQWAPALLIMGLYNKLVKLEGSD